MWKKSISSSDKNNKQLKFKGGSFLNNNLSLSDLEDSTILRENDSLLSLLLKDHTTGKNIKWGTDSYINHGYSFRSDQEIKIDLITGWYEGFIRPRVDKEIDVQLERQRNKAEVFTPSWVIKLQVEAALEDMKELPLLDFIQTKWLEITCGEAPYMVNRYDMETGEVIPLKDRSGFIDVKFKKLNQEIEPEEEWLKLAVEIYKASYGYEYQGDSLLLARENLILTFIDNYFYMFGAFPKEKILLEITKIISLNVFQMDGLTYEVPYSDGGAKEFGTQLSLFDEVEVEDVVSPKLAEVKLWDINKTIILKKMAERIDYQMKFDVVIGNPPYQEDDGGAQASSKPIYQYFVKEAKKLSNSKVSLIIPARWYTGGKGLSSFRNEMLNDDRISLLVDYPNGKDVFPNVKIEGGVCYFVWDKEHSGDVTVKTYEETLSVMKRPMVEQDSDIFIRYNELVTVLRKVKNYGESSFSQFVSPRKPFGLTTNQKLNKEKSRNNDVLVYGNKSVGYVPSTDITSNTDLINKDKIYISYAYGMGDQKLVQVLNKPFIPKNPSVCTETYLVIGPFNKEVDLEYVIKYMKTKFFRALVYIVKNTQHATRRVYEFVPNQDFTQNSDILWNKLIPEIDQQLYKKYNLNEEEIEFIETHIKEME